MILVFYHDQQLEYPKEAIELNYAKPENVTPFFINVVKKVVNNLVMVYLRDAQRVVEGSKADQERLQAMLKQSALNVKIKTVSRYVKLLKTVLIRPVWRGERLDLDIITPELIDVFCGDTPEDLQKVIVTHYGQST